VQPMEMFSEPAESEKMSTLKSNKSMTMERHPSHKIIYRKDSSGTEFSHDSDEENFEETGNEELLISLLDGDDQLLWPKGGHKTRGGAHLHHSIK